MADEITFETIARWSASAGFTLTKTEADPDELDEAGIAWLGKISPGEPAPSLMVMSVVKPASQLNLHAIAPFPDDARDAFLALTPESQQLFEDELVMHVLRSSFDIRCSWWDTAESIAPEGEVGIVLTTEIIDDEMRRSVFYYRIRSVTQGAFKLMTLLRRLAKGEWGP